MGIIMTHLMHNHNLIPQTRWDTTKLKLDSGLDHGLSTGLKLVDRAEK